MGDKITARKTMTNANVPVVPGTSEPIQDIKEAVSIIKDIGLPVMVKASAGGGGKGMRLISDEEEIVAGVSAAKSEAKAAFGNDAVYIEKYINSPHHIEFQVLADKHGNCIHLFERECSVQRRHQKVVEETPSPIMTPEVREEMGKHAVAAAKAVDYASAGTIEFIVDDDLNYYFLEMNTRLQVEHPITERVVGVDLVKEQINIANGNKLSWKQEDLTQNGHAIEVRIYAEDPDNNFMPSPGLVKHITEPLGLGVRHDGYIYEGYSIPMFYDPMVSKLIVWAPTRIEAIDRMKRALHAYKIVGIKTTIPFLSRIMDVPDFKKGKYNTHFIQDNQKALEPKETATQKTKDVMAITAFYDYITKLETNKSNGNAGGQVSNWKMCGRKRNMNQM
jgi:acetyl-CoA carboxylase biotin carboxylase subunit